jgi:arsenate reductase
MFRDAPVHELCVRVKARAGIDPFRKEERRSSRLKILAAPPFISDDSCMAKPRKVLFVCMGNCVRSQMAEALARHHFPEDICAESAGIHPLGFIDPTAREAVEESGASMAGQFSKGLHAHAVDESDLIVNMSGVPGGRVFHGKVFEDWVIADPFGEDLDTHRRIRDDIESRIKALVARLRDDSKKQSATGGA